MVVACAYGAHAVDHAKNLWRETHGSPGDTNCSQNYGGELKAVCDSTTCLYIGNYLATTCFITRVGNVFTVTVHTFNGLANLNNNCTSANSSATFTLNACTFMVDPLFPPPPFGGPGANVYRYTMPAYLTTDNASICQNGAWTPVALAGNVSGTAAAAAVQMGSVLLLLLLTAPLW
jgi:hypothetical protein